MGKAKQLLPYQDTTLLGHAVRTAEDVFGDSLYVVLGAYAQDIPASIPRSRFRTVVNEQWSIGMSTSIRKSVELIEQSHPDTDALLFMAADQPFVRGIHLHGILKAYQDERGHIIASQYGNTLGIPALFDKKYFAELRALEGDRGAKQVILKNSNVVYAIPVEEAAIDIDTPTQYNNLLASDNHPDDKHQA
jgi:molybdenum cofactor cytidylyltransferase